MKEVNDYRELVNENKDFFLTEVDEEIPEEISPSVVKYNSERILRGTFDVDYLKYKNKDGMISNAEIDRMYEDYKDQAANFVIANLMTKKRVLEKGGLLYDDENVFGGDKADVNEDIKSETIANKINDYKEYLFREDTFKSFVKTEIGRKLNYFMGEYREYNDPAGFKALDGKKFAEDYNKAMKRDFSREAEYNITLNPANENRPENKKYGNDSRLELSWKEQDMYRSLYQDMERYNHGQVRKGLNEKMMTALKNVIDKSDSGQLTLNDVKQLRYRAARYYDERKGTIFGPQTGEGKNRLNAAGKILKVSIAIAQNADEKFDTLNREDEALKEEQKNMLEEEKAQKARNIAQKREANNQKQLQEARAKVTADNNKFVQKANKIDFEEKIKSGKHKDNKAFTQDEMIKTAAGFYVKNYVEKYGTPVRENGAQVSLANMVEELRKCPEFTKAIGFDNKGNNPSAENIINAVKQTNNKGDLVMREKVAGKLKCLEDVKAEKDFVKNNVQKPKSLGAL